MIKQIFDTIKQYKKISFFVHIRPDADALGSAIALMNFINFYFHDKQTRLIGKEIIEKNKLNDYLKSQILTKDESLENDEDFIKDSLAIILDTANEERVFTQKHKLAQSSIRIDHHPKIETFCDLEWIDSNSVATCQLIAEMIMEIDREINQKQIINALYLGIMTDSNRFLYEQTSSKTFDIAAWIFSKEFDKQKIHNLLYNKSFAEKKIENKLFAKVKQIGNVGYLIVKNKKIQNSKVSLLADIKDFKIWTAIFYDYEQKIWFGSIRSRDIEINKIAQKYGGGGHKFASGFKLKNKKEFKNLISELNEAIQQDEQND